MKIAYIAPFGLGKKTTVWARTLPLAQVVAAHGHQAQILIPPWDTPADAGRRTVEQGVEMINVSLDGGLPGTVRRLLAAVEAFGPDLVHIVKPRAHAGLVQWWLWQRRSLGPAQPRPILLDVDDWEQAWAPVNRYSWPVARFLAWQEEWGLRHADGITAASNWLLERSRAYAPATPRLYLPNGVTDERPVASPSMEPTATPQVLFFTRFVEVEPEWLAAFWTALRSSAPDVRLLVAGQAVEPEQETPYRRALATSASAGNAVEWLGYIQPAQLDALYSRVSCAIFPAAPVPLQQAKCSVRLAQTLLRGVPVVASAVGEQAAYGAEGAARLVDAAASPADFAVAVADVLRRPAERQALGAQARRRLLHTYDWDRLGKQLVDFYEEFVPSSHTSTP